ncbi:hypothetical protein CDV36_001075 [Fusarium kuroshium]|uniref:PhnB-like domain-containing protein n=1 Tax=Fusarium kuroshium TaxID=2010991 RepID=A0A3M2SNW0_9HYPO|nr:hypothetical protein CDV36_001075 [Fusarium kuroshium]
MSIGKISTCLWFENQAEEAANYYVSIFAPDSKITTIQRYSEAGKEQHGREPGSVMVVEFDLRGHHFVALNGGPAPWKFSEAISLMVDCKDQAEVDHFWEKLGEGADHSRQQCGWLGDKFGIAWQVCRSQGRLDSDPDLWIKCMVWCLKCYHLHHITLQVNSMPRTGKMEGDPSPWYSVTLCLLLRASTLV